MKQPKLCSAGYPAEADVRVSPYDVFIDLSGTALDRIALDEYVDGVVRGAGLAGVAGQVTLVSPCDCSYPIAHAALEIHVVGSPTDNSGPGVCRHPSRSFTPASRCLIRGPHAG